MAFVKLVLSHLVQQALGTPFEPAFFSAFNHVRIKDSTKFILPESTLPYYKGCGGSTGTSKAGIAIQFEYDAKTSQILDFTLTDGSRNDFTDAQQTKGNIEKSDLVIRDLGYFSIPVLKAIQDKQAFFLSRLNTSVSVCEPDGTEFSFEKIYKQMQHFNISTLEVEVLIGKKEKMPVRMILSIVPSEVYEKRVRDLTKSNKERGWTISKETKIRYHFSIFVTNVAQEKLRKEDVSTLYRLRWQVELIFKTWKSTLKIDKLGTEMKPQRYLCLLYAKLILVVLYLQLYSHFQKYIYQKDNIILSRDKCIKTLSERFEQIYGILRLKRKEAYSLARKLEKVLAQNHILEKRKDHISSITIINLFSTLPQDVYF